MNPRDGLYAQGRLVRTHTSGFWVPSLNNSDTPYLPLHPPGVFDYFGREDNASSLGSTDSGQVWIPLQGVWGIDDNKAILKADEGDSQNIVYVDTGAEDGTVSVTLATAGSGTDAGLAFRIVDNNNYYIAVYTDIPGADDLNVFIRSAGTFTRIAFLGTNPIFAGDVLSVEMDGSDFDFKVNGVSKVTFSDSTHVSTNHGLRVHGAGAGAVSMDAFRFIAAEAPAGSVLVIQNASHAHTADNLSLTQAHSLATQNAVHSHTASNLTLTQVHSLAIQGSTHAHTAGNITLAHVHNLTTASATHSHSANSLNLSQVHNLVLAGGTHAHSATNLGLTQVHQLVTASASHSHTAANLTLTQTHILGTQSGVHSHVAENIVLSTAGDLGIANSVHAHSSGNLALTQVHSLVTQNGIHGHTANNLTLSLTYNLSIQTALHSQPADELGLTQAHNLQAFSSFHGHEAQSPELGFGEELQIDSSVHGHTARNISFAWTLPASVLTVMSENRTSTVSAESRSIVVSAPTALEVSAEARVLTVPTEDRTAR